MCICRYLHLQDNKAADVDRRDKLWKLRWFLDFLTARFQELYQVDGFVRNTIYINIFIENTAA